LTAPAIHPQPTEDPNVKRTPVYFLAAACAVLLVAGCGSSKKSSSTQAAPPATQPTTAPSTTPSGGASAGGGKLAGVLKVSADPSGQLKFDKTSLSGKTGNVTIQMGNPSSVPHGIAIKGNGVKKAGQVAQQGGESTVSAKLKPGTYEFYCPVDSHEQAGMKGTLTVK
jgi:plastocyanin